jgi:hypothetical protein
MKLRHVVLFLLLAQLAYSATTCIGYEESFDVRVLDGMGRAVEGAAVNVTFDRGASFGDKYFTTDIRYTDDKGKVHFDINNQGTTTRKIDCDIDIEVSAAGSTKIETIVVDKHGPIVDVRLSDVFICRVYVKDHLGAGIPNATVTVRDQKNLTNGKGFVRHYLKTGNHDYLATYLEAKESGQIEVTDDDVDFVVTFPYYSVEIDVMDDNGVPLDALVTMYNETFQLQNGHFENNRSFGKNINYEIDYKGLKTNGIIMPELDPKVQVVYDIHAPSFDDIISQTVEDRATLTLEVSDPGLHPSGVDVTSILVKYRMEPADPTTPWNTAVVFPTGYNTFTAEISDLPEDAVVQFNAEIKDKDGNRATIDGKFSTLAVEQPVNVTQNQTKPPIEEETSQEIPLFSIVIGAIVLISIVYLGIRIKSRETRGV